MPQFFKQLCIFNYIRWIFFNKIWTFAIAKLFLMIECGHFILYLFWVISEMGLKILPCAIRLSGTLGKMDVCRYFYFCITVFIIEFSFFSLSLVNSCIGLDIFFARCVVDDHDVFSFLTSSLHTQTADMVTIIDLFFSLTSPIIIPHAVP